MSGQKKAQVNTENHQEGKDDTLYAFKQQRPHPPL
jgi:hypothetical protein